MDFNRRARPGFARPGADGYDVALGPFLREGCRRGRSVGLSLLPGTAAGTQKFQSMHDTLRPCHGVQHVARELDQFNGSFDPDADISAASSWPEFRPFAPLSRPSASPEPGLPMIASGRPALTGSQRVTKTSPCSRCDRRSRYATARGSGVGARGATQALGARHVRGAGSAHAPSTVSSQRRAGAFLQEVLSDVGSGTSRRVRRICRLSVDISVRPAGSRSSG